MRRKTIIVVGLLLFFIALGLSAYFINKNRENGKQLSVTGEIKTMDLSPLTLDGSGLFQIQTNRGSVDVDLVSGFSDCDRNAITIPNVKVGNQVEVRGTQYRPNHLIVCEAGTFIRLVR